MSDLSLHSQPDGYHDWLISLKEKIYDSQQTATLAVNQELILLYWNIGNEILERQTARGCGRR